MLNVILDTNVFVRANFSLSGPDLAILKQASQSGHCRVIVPLIVLEETVNKYRERLIEKRRDMSSAIKSLDALLPETSVLRARDLDIDKLTRDYAGRLRASLSEYDAYVPPYEGVPHGGLVKRALERKKPFASKGVGYRDALLWESLLQEVIDRSSECFLVTANWKDFCSEANSNELHKDLVADLVDLDLPETAVRVFSTLKEVVEGPLKGLLSRDVRDLEANPDQVARRCVQLLFSDRRHDVVQRIDNELRDVEIPLLAQQCEKNPRIVKLYDPTYIGLEQSIYLPGARLVMFECLVLTQARLALERPAAARIFRLDSQENDVPVPATSSDSRTVELPFRIKFETPPVGNSGPPIVNFQVYLSDTLFTMVGLLQGIRDRPGERSEEEHACWLLAHLLEWHAREEKAAWWEYFRLRDLLLEDYPDERSALANLTFVDTVSGTARRPVHRYAFPPQDSDIRRGDEVCLPDGSTIGKVDDLDLNARTVDLQHAGKWADERPAHIFVRRNVPSGSKPAALLQLGRWVAEHGIDASGPHRAARDLILRRPPRLLPDSTGLGSQADDEVTTACRLGAELDHGVLPIQAPPGTGKTYIGSRMIVDLIRVGKKVGVTAVSHEVIRNLLQSCIEVAEKEGLEDFNCLHKGKAKESSPEALHAFDDYKRIHALFDHGDYQLLGGTAWLWARDDFAESVDVLFIDEAGQMSLADVLAVSRSAKSLVLLGDPQQLEQPQQANHPSGTGISALKHVIGDKSTIPAAAGLFLTETRRMHPSIGTFTAGVFYDHRLKAHPDLEQQAVVGAARFPEAGLAYVPVIHEGRGSHSEEEVQVIEAIVAELTNGDVAWRDREGKERTLTREDLMIIAPYKAQATALSAALGAVRVGTVDRFQGQQAPVVIVSLTTSTHDEAPRGMSYLYSANRLNVATSRAKGLCILVGNPKLFEPDSRVPAQMQLASAFLQYLDMATIVEIGD